MKKNKEKEMLEYFSKQSNNHTTIKRESVLLQWNLKEGSFQASDEWAEYKLHLYPSNLLLDFNICKKGIHPDDERSLFNFYEECKKELFATVILRLSLNNDVYQPVIISASLVLNGEKTPDYIIVTISKTNDILLAVHSDVKPIKPLVNNSFEMQVALAIRDAYPVNAIFLVAYDLQSDEVLHFNGEIIPKEIKSMEKFSDIQKYYLDYVHEDYIKEIIYNELRLNDIRSKDFKKEEIILEGRVIPPSSKNNKYIWVEITFITYIDTSGRKICCVLARNITAQKDEHKALLQLAGLDPYANILPRMTFEEFCASQKSNRVISTWLNAILLIDISQIGSAKAEGIEYYLYLDKIIKKIEPVFVKHINKKTIVARFSNTKYMVAMHDLSGTNELRERAYGLQSELINAVDDDELSFSVGVSLCPHDKEIGFRCVFDDVEKAMNIAKKKGKNQVVFYKAGMKENDFIDEEKQVFIRTFSNFEVFVNDTPINFKSKKAKELLAILVDRRGGFVSNSEATGMLWEDEPINKQVRTRFRKVAMRLNDILADYGIKDIIEIDGRARRVCAEKITCDLYNYLSHKEKYADTYGGFYMKEYSWAEFTAAELNKELFI